MKLTIFTDYENVVQKVDGSMEDPWVDGKNGALFLYKVKDCI